MIKKSKLGTGGPQVGRLGYGAMVLEGYYGASDDGDAVKTLVHAIENGMMIDTADAYGGGHNETLVGKAMKAASTPAFVATKFGIVFDDSQAGSEVPTGWGFSLNINGTKGYAKRALEQSLRALQTDCIDLWYAHYLDPNTPVEETVSAMAEAVKEGKVKHIGLSNVTAEEVQRANAVHPISAVQFEYSMWRREAEVDLIPALRRLGIALVAWSPLGGGFLTGTVRSIAEGDFRNTNPRYSPDNLKLNNDRFAPVRDVAQDLGVSPGQLALAWLLHQGDDIFPIPGTRRIARIDENNASLNVDLDSDILSKLDELAKPGLAEGATLV